MDRRWGARSRTHPSYLSQPTLHPPPPLSRLELHAHQLIPPRQQKRGARVHQEIGQRGAVAAAAPPLGRPSVK